MHNYIFQMCYYYFWLNKYIFLGNDCEIEFSLDLTFIHVDYSY